MEVQLYYVRTEIIAAESFFCVSPIIDYCNLLPCRPGANLQKGSSVFDPTPLHFFLAIASTKKTLVDSYLLKIEQRKNRGRALILLQQCLERGDLTAEEVSNILQEHSEAPEGIFQLIAGMHFSDSAEVRFVAKAEIDELRGRSVRLGQNDHIDGVTLTNASGQTVDVRTCAQYDDALENGYFAYSTFDTKMSTWFEHQCGLLRSLKAATLPLHSFISEPRVGVLDLALLPFSLFPRLTDENDDIVDLTATYQSKVNDGTLVVKTVGQNILVIEEPQGMGQKLVEAARADFNGDGIEDILIWEYCYATHGTLGFGRIRVLTRTSVDGSLQEVFSGDA